MRTMRVVKALNKSYLSFAWDDEIFAEIEITESQRLKLSNGSVKEVQIMDLDADQNKFVKIGQNIAFFDKDHDILMVSKVNRIVHSDDYMVTAAGDFKPREFTFGIRDDRFVFFVDYYDYPVYGSNILRNVRHIDRVVDQLIPDILP